MSYPRSWALFLGATTLLAATSIGTAQDVQPIQPDQADTYSSLPGAEVAYPYVSREQELGDALRVFARNLQIAVRIDDTVQGTIVESDALTLTTLQYLDSLAEEFNFVWYFDGILLNIVDVATFRTEVLPLQNNDGLVVIELLKQLDIFQDKFLHRADLKNQALMVKGPESYVEIVRQAVEAIERADRKTVTLLRGSADDKFVGGPGLDPAAAAETVDPTQ